MILAPIAGAIAFVGVVCSFLWLAGFPLSLDQAVMAGGVYAAGWSVVLVLDALSGRFGIFDKGP